MEKDFFLFITPLEARIFPGDVNLCPPKDGISSLRGNQSQCLINICRIVPGSVFLLEQTKSCADETV